MGGTTLEVGSLTSQHVSKGGDSADVGAIKGKDVDEQREDGDCKGLLIGGSDALCAADLDANTVPNSGANSDLNSCPDTPGKSGDTTDRSPITDDANAAGGNDADAIVKEANDTDAGAKEANDADPSATKSNNTDASTKEAIAVVAISEEANDASAKEASDATAKEASDATAKEASDATAKEASDATAKEASDATAKEASDATAKEDTKASAKEDTEASAREATEASAKEVNDSDGLSPYNDDKKPLFASSLIVHAGSAGDPQNDAIFESGEGVCATDCTDVNNSLVQAPEGLKTGLFVVNVGENAKTLVVVTGANGFVGSHCVYQLLDLGYSVRGTVRDKEDDKNKFLLSLHPRAASALELVSADLQQKNDWDKVMVGADYVIHTASPFPFKKPKDDKKEVIEPALKGVENVLGAAGRSKTVKRVVMTSSVVAIVQGHDSVTESRVFTEKDWSVVDHQDGYGKSKSLAERRAWEMVDELNKKLNETGASKEPSDGESEAKNAGDKAEAPAADQKREEKKDGDSTCPDVKASEEPQAMDKKKDATGDADDPKASVEAGEKKETLDGTPGAAQEVNAFELVCINPGFVFGPVLSPRHAQDSASSQALLTVLMRRHPFIPHFGVGFVDVRDTAECHIRALLLDAEKVHHKRFIAVGTTCSTFHDMAMTIKEEFSKYGFRPVSREAPSWLIKLLSSFSSEIKSAEYIAGKMQRCDNGLAVDCLGMEFRGLHEMITDHCWSLMQTQAIPWRKTPHEKIESFKPYREHEVYERLMGKKFSA